MQNDMKRRLHDPTYSGTSTSNAGTMGTSTSKAGKMDTSTLLGLIGGTVILLLVLVVVAIRR